MQFFSRSGAEVQAHAASIDEAKGRATYTTLHSCARCGGAGQAEKWRHTGLTCFDCQGRGKWPVAAPCFSAERLAKLNATQAKAQAKREAIRAAKAAAILAERRAGFDAWQAANASAVANVCALPTVEGSFRARIVGSIVGGEVVTETGLHYALHDVVKHYAAIDHNEASTYAGEVGARQAFALTVNKVLDFSAGQYPRVYFYINLCTDDAGRNVVYKGSNVLAEVGETVKVKATVKAHEMRNGERQTIIARPKYLD